MIYSLAHTGFHGDFLHFITEPDHLAFLMLGALGLFYLGKKLYENR